MVLLGLQLLAVLAVNGWGEESFQQLAASTLVSQSPMAFAGLLLMLIGARLEDPRAQRTPQHNIAAALQKRGKRHDEQPLWGPGPTGLGG